MRWLPSRRSRSFAYHQPGYGKKSSSRLARPWLILALVVLLFFIIGTFRGLATKIRVQNELDSLQQQIQFYKKDTVDLTKMLEYLNSDAFVTTEARRSLGLGQVGEQPVVVNTPSSSAPVPAVIVASSPAPSNLQLWWDYFFSRS